MQPRSEAERAFFEDVREKKKQLQEYTVKPEKTVIRAQYDSQPIL